MSRNRPITHPPRHFQNLPGTRTIKTEEFCLVARAINDAQEHAAMIAIVGDAGLGKSFAVDHALTEKARLPVARLEFPPRSSMRYLAQRILKEITGIAETGGRFVLTENVLEVLAEEPRILLVREAQRLGGELIEYLRMLHDHPATRFALILEGGNNCWKVLRREPMLHSRIYRRVEFVPLTQAQVLRWMPTFHLLFEGAEPELLLFVDEHWARGNLRRWAAFTHTALSICQRHKLERCSEEVARNAFALLTGGGAAHG
jgi:type II secretory pathway predicted ATPase ExeA